MNNTSIERYKLNRFKRHMKNRDRNIKKVKQWASNNAEHIRKYKRNYNKMRRTTDQNFRLREQIRRHTRRALSGNISTELAVSTLGCTSQEFREYLRRNLSHELMWENVSKYQIDHIRPLADFDLTQEEQYKTAAHYTNVELVLPAVNYARANKKRLESRLKYYKKLEQQLDNACGNRML